MMQSLPNWGRCFDTFKVCMCTPMPPMSGRGPRTRMRALAQDSHQGVGGMPYHPLREGRATKRRVLTSWASFRRDLRLKAGGLCHRQTTHGGLLMSNTASATTQRAGGYDTDGYTTGRRVSTETKASFKTTELIAYVVTVVGVILAAMMA